MKKIGIKSILLCLVLLIFWNYVACDVCNALQGRIDLRQYLEITIFNYHKILFNNAICILIVLLVTSNDFKREEYLVRAKTQNFLIQMKELVKCSILYSVFVMLVVIGSGLPSIKYTVNSAFWMVQYGFAYLLINYGFGAFFYLLMSIKNRKIAFGVESVITMIILLIIHYYIFYFCDVPAFQMEIWIVVFFLIGILCSFGLYKDLKEKEYM